MKKTIGIIGGMSHESTVTYYEHIHAVYRQRFKDFDYPPIVIYSMPFSDCVRWTENGSWEEAAEALADAANRLHRAGADFALMATNTMHIVFDQVERGSLIPLLNIIDVTAGAIKDRGYERAGLLGTTTTMETGFYRDRLERNGIQAIVPEKRDMLEINRIIYEELTAGKILTESRSVLTRIIEDLGKKGAQGVVLGCTEIPLLVRQRDTSVPLFDTTRLHAEAALDLSLI